MDTITRMLTLLGIPERSQAIYLDLLTHGEGSARQLATRVGVPRSSVYDHLAPLLARGLVVEKDMSGKAFFVIHDLTELDRQVAKTGDSIGFLRQQFAKVKDTVGQSTLGGEPRIKFVTGREGVSALLTEMLWDAAGTIETLWPYEEMLQVFTAEELELFNRKRIKQNIALRSIWTGPVPKKQHLWQGVDFKVERKVAPKNYAAPMGYSIYGDRVAFWSSAREQYAFVVHSTDFAVLMRTQFAGLWQASK